MKTLWDLSRLIPRESKDQIEKEKQKIIESSYKFINKWKDDTTYLENPKILKEALVEYEDWLGYFAGGGNIGYYFGLKHALNQNDPEVKAHLAKINELTTKIENDIQFFEYNLSKISPEKQELFIKSENLKKYHHFLESLFKNAKYLLSEKEEKILNLTQETARSNWIRLTSGILSKEEELVLTEEGKKEKKNLSEITSLLNSRDKKVRDLSAGAFNHVLEKTADIAENEINSILQNKKVIDELKQIERPDLPRHLADDIETEIVDVLIKKVTEGFNISRKYYELKANLLSVEKLKYHERNVDFGEIKSSYSFEESVELIKKVLYKLDPSFSSIFSDLLETGSVDVYPKKGKVYGAFCTGGLISQPNYILLNHTNRLTDVLTLAHETGHAIHNYLGKEKQSPINYGTSLATAEVASTFIEDFVLDEISKNANPQDKLAILMYKLNDDVSTIFRQVACYNFELALHRNFREKGYLSKDFIGKLFQEHMKAYMGNFVEQSKGSENWWVYWGHIRSFFYVYSYASGLLISKSLRRMVKEDYLNISKIKSFLSAGESKSPQNIFEDIGINIFARNFWDGGLSEVEKLLTDTIRTAKYLNLAHEIQDL